MAKLRRNRLFFGFLIVAACVIGVIGQPYTYVPADRGQGAGGVRGADVRILPTTFLREYDPITVFFGRDAVPGEIGPIEPPGQQVLAITPAHPGEFIKIDARTIEFRPAAPWAPHKRYRVVSGRTARELVTLLPVPSEVSPASGSAGHEPVSRVGLKFTAKVDPQVLSRLANFEICPLPGVDGRGCRALRATEYKVSESILGASEFMYWFNFNESVGYGRRIRMTLKLAERAAGFADAQRVYTFETKPEFMIDKAGTYSNMLAFSADGNSYDARQAIRLGRDRSIVIEFTAPVSDPGLTAIKSMVAMTPAPSDFSYTFNDNRLVINPGIEQERLYRITINPVALRDRSGRALTNRRPSSFFAYLPKIEPSAQWARGSGIVERFGPQHFPIKTTAVSALDFRIYRIDPFHSAFSQFPTGGQIPVRESTRPPGPGEEPSRMTFSNSDEDDWSESRRRNQEIPKHIRMLGSPHFSGIIDLDREGVDKLQSIDLKPMLASISGKDRPGTYLVGFRLLEGSPVRFYARVDVTDLCLTTVESKSRAVFAVTSYTNGRAVQDANIRIDGIVGDTMATLAQGKTNREGMFTLEHTPALERIFEKAVVRRIVVSKDDDMLILNTTGSGSAPLFADNHWYHSSGSEWLNWLKSKPYSVDRDRRLRGFVRTERPIYRPEDSVYIKGYVRETQHGKIMPPPQGTRFVLRVYSPSGKSFDHDVELNEFGAFDVGIVPPDEATGGFRVALIGAPNAFEIASTDFTVEAYRIPRFELRLSGADRIPNDAPADIRAIASYYAGGRVVGQEIAWKVTSFPYDHRPRGYAGYLLSSDGRYGAVTEERRQGVLEENGVTDETGSAKITLNPQAATSGNPTRYIVEATVTDADRQTVSARHSVIALPPFTLGLRADRHITSGSTISARVVAIGVKDSLIAGQNVNVQLKRVSWTSYLAETDFSRGRPKYVTDESVELIEEKSVTTAGKPVSVEFHDRQPGVYIIELSSRDRLGRLQTVKIDVFLAGDAPQTWKKAEQKVFETVTDRNSYEPGQQAKILIKSPYRNALALAIVERPNGDIQYRWISINDGQGTFTLDIQQEMAPRVPVSFMLMRPRSSVSGRADEGMRADAGKPETIGNTTWLTVNPVANMLDVKLTHAPAVTPDGTLDVTVTLHDIQGRARVGEVALWLVDEAVLSLRSEKKLDPLEAFLEEVNSHITIRDSRNLALGRLHANENPGGDGAENEDGDVLGQMTPRKNFKTVPYWNPSIRIGRSGSATVKIRMPSDLTNFAIRAMAVSGPDMFGNAKSRVSVRLPVIVQPALPRFVRLGDRIRAGGVARVVEGQGGAASWSINAKGLAVKSAASGQIQLDNLKPLQLFSDLHVETPPFTAEGKLQWDSVSIKMAVMRNSDRAGDAFEIRIPVLPDRPFIEETQFAEIAKGKNFSWRVLSEQPRPNTVLSNLLISDNHYLPKMLSAMTALVRFPYGCTEQVVSQSFPSLVYAELLDRYGIATPGMSLKQNVGRTLEFLKAAQHGDGLFGYWPGSAGYVYLTAYVVDFLTEVNKANEGLDEPLAFDQKMYASAIEALKRSLRSDSRRFVSGYASFERTAALAALANAGHIDIGYARELAAAANELNIQGMANIYKAVADRQSALGREYASLEDMLWKSVIFAQRQGAQSFEGFNHPGHRASDRMHYNDAATLASFVSAMSSTQGEKRQRTILLADELSRMATDNGWGSTFANSVSLLALREFMDNAPSANHPFRFNDGDRAHQVTVNGAISRYWANGKAGDVSYAGQDNRAFWARLSRRYMPQSLGSSAEPQQRGFAVKRAVLKVNGGRASERIALDRGGSAITLTSGDVVEEHVQVVNPEARNFVAVSIPIAAGFEPLNPRLENAPSDARPTNRTTNEGTYSAFFDDHVVYFFERMEQGTYDFYFRTRAITEGEFTHPPAKAEMMYRMDVHGTSAGSRITVNAKME